MPYCEVCHYRLDENGHCRHCDSRLEWEAEQAAVVAAEEQRRFEEYQGDTYLTDSWIEYGVTPEEAIAQVQNPQSLCWMLESGQLEYILADRWATQALRRELMAGNRALLECLLIGTKRLKNSRGRRKRGPRPKNGMYAYEQVRQLRDERHMTFGQIARKVWKDPKKDRLAAAHYRQAIRKTLPPRAAIDRTPQ
jgi:hypothetical protein